MGRTSPYRIGNVPTAEESLDDLLAVIRKESGFESYGRPNTSSWPDAIKFFQFLINISLQSEAFNARLQLAHAPFYFDYVDAGVVNAHAVEHGGFCFILFTAPLVQRIFTDTFLLAKSKPVCDLFTVEPVAEYNVSRLQRERSWARQTFQGFNVRSRGSQS